MPISNLPWSNQPQLHPAVHALRSPWAEKLYSKMSREELKRFREKQDKKNIAMVRKSIKKDGTQNVCYAQAHAFEGVV